MSKRAYKSGADRSQLALLPPCIEDYVGPDNPVRAVDAYVDGLDLEALGFRHAGAYHGPGQPPIDPALHLKLYLYGYQNQVRSSRRLAAETTRNIEVIWLLSGLRPSRRAICDFRKDNAAALRAAHRDFISLMGELGLLGRELVAVDGSFFHGDASKASITTKAALEKRLAAIEAEIAAYQAELDARDAMDDAAEDAAEAAQGEEDADGGEGRGKDDAGLEEKLAALKEKQGKRKAELAELEASGRTQLSRTDPDARLLKKNGKVVAGYNVQTAVDAEHKLIVADAVTSDGNDTGQLAGMAQAAKEALGVETLAVAADGGYWEGEQLRACEEAGVTAFVPEPARKGKAAAAGRFGPDDFVYDRDADVYRCPGEQELAPLGGPTADATGKPMQRYASKPAACRACPLRARCLTEKARRREVRRWVHADVIERHRARMATEQGEAMRRARSGIVEHPFGTLKHRAGWRHFLVRGLEKVTGEWSVMALAYNFTRVLSIMGVEGFRAALAARKASLCAALRALWAGLRALGAARALFGAALAPRSRPRPLALA